MIAEIVACALSVGVPGGVCAWAYHEGSKARKARRRIAQAPIRDLAPAQHGPAVRRIRPEDPRLREPLSERERTAFEGITGESRPGRRSLVAAIRTSPGAGGGEPPVPGDAQRPAAGARPAFQSAGWQEGCEGPGVLGGSPAGPRTSPQAESGRQ